MNKDHELKNSLVHTAQPLKGRISDMLKGTRDQTEEVKNSRAKTLPIIPVTGMKPAKYLDNKSPRAY